MSRLGTGRAGLVAAATAAVLAVLAAVASGANVKPPELISAAPDGSAGNWPSLFPSVSENGGCRFVTGGFNAQYDHGFRFP